MRLGEATRRLEAPYPRHQRQSYQAVRRERTRGRPERLRVIHANHESFNPGQTSRRLRLWCCGRGIAANFRNASSLVTVIDTNPVTLLNACLDGFCVQDREKALREADMVITATGADVVVRGEDLAHFKDDVILANAGHF